MANEKKGARGYALFLLPAVALRSYCDMAGRAQSSLIRAGKHYSFTFIPFPIFYALRQLCFTSGSNSSSLAWEVSYSAINKARLL